MTIVERMFCIIDDKKLKSADLARVLNINTSVISTWKKRNKNPPAEYLSRICEFLGVSISYLVTGEPAPIELDSASNFLILEELSQKIDYSRGILHLKDDTIFIRFKEARAASGVSLEDAAKGAFLTEDELQLLEDDNIPSEQIESRMKKLQEIGLEQYAYLAFRYNVDLYWLLCGKVRPPAAVVHDGRLEYPPYEFMMEAMEESHEDRKQERPADYSHLNLTEDQEHLLEGYSLLSSEGKTWINHLIYDRLKNTQKISTSPQDEKWTKDGTA